jgi:hypothetical protein
MKEGRKEKEKALLLFFYGTVMSENNIVYS